jgi:hypothetical protein
VRQRGRVLKGGAVVAPLVDVDLRITQVSQGLKNCSGSFRVPWSVTISQERYTLELDDGSRWTFDALPYQDSTDPNGYEVRFDGAVPAP